MKMVHSASAVLENGGLKRLSAPPTKGWDRLHFRVDLNEVDLSVRHAPLRTVNLVDINEFNDRSTLPA